MKERSQRQLRVGEQIRHLLAECLTHGNFNDPVLYSNTQNVIISEVRISPDLRNATAYMYTLGGKDFDIILKGLNSDARIFQHYIGKSLNLRVIPRVRFKEDESFDNAHTIESLISEINKNKKPNDQADDAEAE